MLYHTDKTILFFNGNFRNVKDFKISPFNQTLHYGYGVFEGIRAYHTAQGPHLFKVRRHFERLLASSEKMGISVPYTSQELINYAYELIEKNGLKEAYVRPLVFMDKNMTLRADAEHPNVLMTCWKWTRYYDNNELNVMVSSWRRLHPKTTYIDSKIIGHFPNDILATKEARDKGYDEALMLDLEGYVAQGPGCSFFYEKNGKLYVPPSDKVFPSITRQTLMDIAKQMGIEVIEREFGVEDVTQADGAFFTGTAAEVAGVKFINGHQLKLDWEDTIGHLLHNRYKRIVSGKDTNFLEYF
ncbi:MAG: branched-chain-amino-acid transaminase [Chitinophagales bacterium]|nr:branched-chain-amino-acid transaminase [Chitinophagales bacterium]MCZ2394660.1 branched-chain-amino-acid transaminase [Chitinophagales bacterium]